MVVRNCFHGLFDELVPFIFKSLAVAELASIHTASEIVILRRRRGRPRISLVIANNV